MAARQPKLIRRCKAEIFQSGSKAKGSYDITLGTTREKTARPAWKDELIGVIIEAMDVKDSHVVEILISEPYIRYLSPQAIEKLADSKAFGVFLFKEMNYLPETMPLEISIVLQRHGRQMTPEWFEDSASVCRQSACRCP